MSSLEERRDGDASAGETVDGERHNTASRAARAITDIDLLLRGKSKETVDRSKPLTLLRSTRELLRALTRPEFALRDDIKDIKQQLTRIETNSTKTTAAVRSYASMTALATQPNASSPIDIKMSVLEQQRQLNEIKKRKTVLIKIRDEKERAVIGSLLINSLMTRLRRAEETEKDILAVKRLPSGDIELFASSMEARARIETNEEVMKCLASSAYVIRRTYAVLAHGLRVDSVNTTQQEKGIAELEKQNDVLHPGLRINRIAWTKKAVIEAKTHSSLIIEVATAEMANRLIKEGLLQDYSHRVCEYFDKICRIKQCFNCQKYGHVGSACRNAMRCASCSMGHQSSSCKAPLDQRKCAVCGGRHSAWSFDCPVRKEEKERLNRIWNSRPYMHVELGSIVLPRGCATRNLDRILTSSFEPSSSVIRVDLRTDLPSEKSTTTTLNVLSLSSSNLSFLTIVVLFS